LLGNKYYYWGLSRKYQAIFGSVFNNIIIERNDEEGNLTQQINVPIAYQELEKMMTRLKADAAIDRQAAVILPTMSFFMDGITYNSERTIARTNLTNINQVNSSATTQYAPAPYDFHFSLQIYVKNVEDANKILEQILPYFTPNFTVRAFLIPGAPAVDLPITLNKISHNLQDTTSFKDYQMHIWTLNFTMCGAFWGPQTTRPTINLANVAFMVGTPPVANSANLHAFGLTDTIINTAQAMDANVAGYETFQPGLTDNGQPTSNIADSIPVANINWSDDWGVIELVNGIQYE